MRRLSTITALIALVVALSAWGKDDERVVIENLNNHFTLEPDKDRTRIVSIKEQKSIGYKALRNNVTAYAATGYNDYVKVNSAKAKGAKPIYGSGTTAGIFYNDSRMCIIPIRIEKAGESTEAKFECVNSHPEMGISMFIGEQYPVENYRLTVTIPIEMRDIYNISVTNLADSCYTIARDSSPDGKWWNITLSASNLPKLSLPDGTPPARAALPYLRLTGMFADVNDYYCRMSQYAQRPDPQIAAVGDMAKQITGQCTSERDKIAAIFHWVNDNIRYIAIEHGELGWEPDLASSVLEKRYGDCKGSANLIKEMLKAVGIDGRLVWIGTAEIPDKWTDYPMFSTGNHQIAAAILPGDSILYLDGTVGVADLGYYSPGIQGKQTIIENGDQCIVHQVPMMLPEWNADEVRVDYTIRGTQLVGKYTETVSGSYKSSLLNRLRSTDQHSHTKLLKQYVNEGRKSWSFDSIAVTGTEPDKGPAVVTAAVTRNNALQQAVGYYYVALDLLPSLGSMLYDLKERTAPGYISSNHRIVRQSTIQLPDTMQISQLPESFSVANDCMKGTLHYTLANHTLTAILTIDMNQGIIPRNELERFNSDIRALRKAVNNIIIITPNISCE